MVGTEERHAQPREGRMGGSCQRCESLGRAGGAVEQAIGRMEGRSLDADLPGDLAQELLLRQGHVVGDVVSLPEGAFDVEREKQSLHDIAHIDEREVVTA